MENYESNLIEKLRNQLDKDGFETNTLDSGKLLHQLGKFYRSQTRDKYSLLKCAVLYNAAIQRDVDHADVKNDIQDLSQQLLADISNPNFDLVTLGNVLKARISNVRKIIHDDIENSQNMQEIAEDFDVEILDELQKRKIDEISAINEKINAEYNSIFSEFAEEILDNIGIPPCRYCFVHGKSFDCTKSAPFSEFKGMILFEEGIEKGQDYANVVEYFNRFETFFNFGIINLGETSINDDDFPILNERKLKFQDRVAPPGISWNKFTLKVGNSNEIVLVKSVEEMKNYLFPGFLQQNCVGISDSDIVKFIDILSDTQFVLGDRELYDDFLSFSSEAIRKNYEFYNKHINEKLNCDYIQFNVLYKYKARSQDDKYNVRIMLCTLSNMYVKMLGKRNKCVDMSCFDILTTLGEKKVLSNRDETTLKYALALSSEVRLKSNFGKFLQKIPNYDSEDDLRNLNKEIGLQSAVDYFVIMSSLQDNLINNNGKILLDLRKISVYVISILITNQEQALNYCMRVQSMEMPSVSEDIKPQADTLKVQSTLALIFVDIVKQMNKHFSSDTTCDISPVALPKKNALIEALGKMLSLTEDQTKQIYLLGHNLFQRVNLHENDHKNSLAISTAFSFIKNNISLVITLALQYLRSLDGQEASQKAELKVKGKMFLKNLKRNVFAGTSSTRSKDGTQKRKAIGKILKESASESLKSVKRDPIYINEAQQQKIVETLDQYGLRKPIERIFLVEKLMLWVELFGLTNEDIVVELLNELESVNLNNANLETIVNVISNMFVKFVLKYRE